MVTAVPVFVIPTLMIELVIDGRSVVLLAIEMPLVFFKALVFPRISVPALMMVVPLKLLLPVSCRVLPVLVRLVAAPPSDEEMVCTVVLPAPT